MTHPLIAEHLDSDCWHCRRKRQCRDALVITAALRFCELRPEYGTPAGARDFCQKASASFRDYLGEEMDRLGPRSVLRRAGFGMVDVEEIVFRKDRPHPDIYPTRVSALSKDCDWWNEPCRLRCCQHPRKIVAGEHYSHFVVAITRETAKQRRRVTFLDFTARQFKADAPFPLVWSEETTICR
jgi:hypothetical protein